MNEENLKSLTVLNIELDQAQKYDYKHMLLENLLINSRENKFVNVKLFTIYSICILINCYFN